MKVDGYTPLEAGAVAKLEYKLPYGDLSITVRHGNARHDKKFAKALNEHQDWVARQERLGSDDDEDTAKRFLEFLYDHLVVDWSTTVKSGGKAIKATRDNFVALLSTPALDRAAALFFEDVSDKRHFRPKTEEQDTKN